MSDLITRAPCEQNIVDVFAGEWSSKMPVQSGLISGGFADAFADDRITWAESILGPLRDNDILELGPLEGAHSYMLHRLGVRTITAIEANPRAFLRLLCVKEIFGLTSLVPMLGNFVPYLERLEDRRFDVVFASGVLYHMVEPLHLLALLSEATDRLFIWTHYYDQDVVATRPEASLFGQPEQCSHDEFTCIGARRAYANEALAWSGFSGGADSYAVWLTRHGIIDFLRTAGFTRIDIGFDHAMHQNGPAFAIAAMR